MDILYHSSEVVHACGYIEGYDGAVSCTPLNPQRGVKTVKTNTKYIR